MSNEKLAEALRESFEKWFATQETYMANRLTRLPNGDYQWTETQFAWLAWQAHAAEAAQAQAQGLPFTQKQFTDALTTSGSVRREAVDDSVNWDGGLTFDNIGSAYRALEMLVAAAPQQAAEPVGMLSIEDDDSIPQGKTAVFHYADACLRLPVGYHEIYTHPQPAQDAKDEATIERVARAIYAHVFTMSIPRMGVRTATFEEVWATPSERERLTAQARAAIDAAMAKESGQ